MATKKTITAESAHSSGDAANIAITARSLDAARADFMDGVSLAAQMLAEGEARDNANFFVRAAERDNAAQKRFVASYCSRRSRSEPPCRSNSEPG